MEAFISQFAGYGPVALMVAFVLFLLRGQLFDLIRGGLGDTERLVRAISSHTAAVKEQTEHLKDQTANFSHNNQMFHAMGHKLDEAVAELRSIKDEIIRNAK